MNVSVRAYQPSDETAWTRCRTLAFLDTAYFDDVTPAKPSYEGASIELVAHDGDGFVGLLDATIDGQTATIETIATHPDHQRSGVGDALLTRTRRLLPSAVTVLDAWTRDDLGANNWYRTRGFEESFRYLHVYASGNELAEAVAATRHELTAVAGFFHAHIEAEAELRQFFHRLPVCRQYALRLR